MGSISGLFVNQQTDSSERASPGLKLGGLVYAALQAGPLSSEQYAIVPKQDETSALVWS